MAKGIIGEVARHMVKGAGRSMTRWPGILIPGAAVAMVVIVGPSTVAEHILDGLHTTEGAADGTTSSTAGPSKGFEGTLEQAVTSSAHGGLFPESHFIMGIISHPNKTKIGEAVGDVANATGDHSATGRALAACGIAAANGELGTRGQDTARDQIFDELKGTSFSDLGPASIPTLGNWCLTTDYALLDGTHAATFPMPLGETPATIK